ncbi:MAG: PAS domain-containing protein [Methanoregula sp.]|jgi:PAS domain S-box-containing protein|uniref:PAS domain-containing protein n=1 Tax=Methanoregula sp. TaxID=2052170 RepID=UPI003C720FCE
MVDTGRLTWPVQRREDFLRIVVYIILSTALIFIVDIITPLGVMIWILYLIPLFLTVYLSWKYAPILMTGVFILLMAASLFLSPRDLSIEYALIDRIFFALILVIASFFIKDYIANVEDIVSSEERYRSLIEWLPEGVVVYRQGGIAYINPAGSRLIGADSGKNLAGCDIVSMVDPDFQALFRQRVDQAAHGARMNLDKVKLIRQDNSDVVVDMFLGTVFWDNGTAVQIVMRPA